MADDKDEPRYPLLEALYPPAPAPARHDPLRQPGAPIVAPRQRPREPAPKPPLGPGAERPGELIDFVLYGTDDQGTQEVHMAFREEVWPGIYLKLRFEADGVRAIFQVRDVQGRRVAAAYGEDILARLRDRGLKTLGVEIEEVVDEESG